MRPPAASPSGSTSSSPPERIATIGRWCTWTSDRPREASMPSCAGPSSVPASSTASPRRMSSPASRMFSPGCRGNRDLHPVTPGRGVLLDHHRVRARRNRCTGEDSRRLPGRQRAFALPPGCDLVDHRELHRSRFRSPGEILRSHRIAVHGRAIRRREGAARDHGRRQHPPLGIDAGDRLAPEDGASVENDLLGLRDRDSNLHEKHLSARTRP